MNVCRKWFLVFAERCMAPGGGKCENIWVPGTLMAETLVLRL